MRSNGSDYRLGIVAGFASLLMAAVGATSDNPESITPISEDRYELAALAREIPVISRAARLRVEVEIHIAEPEPGPEAVPQSALVHYDVGPVKSHVQAAADEIGTKFGVSSIGGVSHRSGASDHPLGLALDFMVGRSVGDAIADFVYQHRERLSVKYMIWRQRINALDGRGWRWMEDRGGTTANHYDHVHVSFYNSK
jgi:hypothetical protein